MTPLLALALAAAPACPAALADAAALDDAALAREARRVARELDAGGAGPVDALAAEAADGARFRAALARHCAWAAAPAAPAAPRDAAALREILARPEYARAAVDPAAVRRALLALWERLLEALGTAEAERYAVAGRTLFLAAAAVALLLAAGAVRRRRARGRPRAPAPAPRAADAGVAVEAAEAALARGEAGAAIRLALLAALAALERAGRVPRGGALTNGELVRELDGPPGAARADLSALAALFDRTVYGGRPAAPDEARAAVAHARRVIAAEAAR